MSLDRRRSCEQRRLVSYGATLMRPRVHSALYSGVVLALAFGTGPTLAGDATAVADAIIAAIDASGNKATYESASASGDEISIAGYEMVNTTNGGTMSIPTIIVTGAEEREKGGFTAAGMRFDDGTLVS